MLPTENGSWSSIMKLRLYTSDEKLVAILGPNWINLWAGSPNSSAMVFTIPGNLGSRRTIQYFQPADRTLKTFDELLPAADVFPDQVIWSNESSSFFLVVSSSQEVDSIDPLKGQFLQVDRSIGNIQDLNYAWVGGKKMESNSSGVPCYAGQP